MLPSLGTLKGIGSGLYNMGRGALFLGASKGATGAGKTMNALGHAVPLAPAVAGSFKATSNQPGFQPQSTVKTSEDVPAWWKDNSLSEKVSVSREWINQRVQNAVNTGVSPQRLLDFSDRNERAAQANTSKVLNALHQGGSAPSLEATAKRRLASLAGSVGAIGSLSGQGYSYELPELSFTYNGQTSSTPGSSHRMNVPPPISTSYVPPPISTSSDGAASAVRIQPNSRLFRNAAIAGGVGLGAYGLYRAFKKDDTKAPTPNQNLHPVVERALQAKIASGSGLNWHRPVNALSYAAFAAPYLSNRVHDNHKLTTALNAAGLLGLGATSADSLANGDGLAGYDLAGLGLMGAGLIHSGLRPDVKTAGP